MTIHESIKNNSHAEEESTTRFAGLAADVTGIADERPPLVFLHGLTFDRRMWRPALRELEVLDPGRRAVAFDLPGHGQSPDLGSYRFSASLGRGCCASRRYELATVEHEGRCDAAAAG